MAAATATEAAALLVLLLLVDLVDDFVGNTKVFNLVREALAKLAGCISEQMRLESIGVRYFP